MNTMFTLRPWRMPLVVLSLLVLFAGINPVYAINKLEPIRRGDIRFPKIALTLDDGQHCDYRIFELLASYNIKCSVFIQGSVAQRDTKLMMRLTQMDFEVCNHTYSHAHLKKLSNEQIKQEILKGQKYITANTHHVVPYLRPPYGEYDGRIKNVAASLGYRLVIWSNTFCDTAKRSDADKQLKWVEANTKNGDIILCHFGGHHTYDIMKSLIPNLLAKGYTFCKVSELNG